VWCSLWGTAWILYYVYETRLQMVNEIYFDVLHFKRLPTVFLSVWTRKNYILSRTAVDDPTCCSATLMLCASQVAPWLRGGGQLCSHLAPGRVPPAGSDPGDTGCKIHLVSSTSMAAGWSPYRTPQKAVATLGSDVLRSLRDEMNALRGSRVRLSEC
jgi:hypothetical protein